MYLFVSDFLFSTFKNLTKLPDNKILLIHDYTFEINSYKEFQLACHQHNISDQPYFLHVSGGNRDRIYQDKLLSGFAVAVEQ